MIERRSVLLVLGAAAFAPRVVLAQAKRAPVVIGWLYFSARDLDGRRLVAFKEGLAALGWKEGSQFVIEERWADGHRERLQPLAEEIAAKKPAVIVAAPSPSVGAAAKAAPATPIVQASGGDPVVAGLAASLARPGGMITGLSNFASDLPEKYLELLLAAAPKIQRVGFLSGARPGPLKDAQIAAMRRSVAQHSVEARFEEALEPEEIEPAVSRLAKQGVQALVVLLGPFLLAHRQRIVKLTLARRWPVISGERSFAEAGALLSYGVDTSAVYRRAAYYVDRILKGTQPGDLPIEQATTFELVVNLKTAKALGITIPQSFLARADGVIE